MEKAFNALFEVSKDKVQTFLSVGSELHTGTMFGMLFEPWFHARISEQGYTGKLRKLTTGRELVENKKKKKRNVIGMVKDHMGIKDHTIPASPFTDSSISKKSSKTVTMFSSIPTFQPSILSGQATEKCTKSHLPPNTTKSRLRRCQSFVRSSQIGWLPIEP